jgi:U3 small nucleolar RNA-associated protein 20
VCNDSAYQFQVVAVLLRDVNYLAIGDEQMKTLLLYAEQYMCDFNRQATAFSLLKAVLARKLVAPEIHDVMNKVAKLSITSEFAHVRLQARQVTLKFMGS